MDRTKIQRAVISVALAILVWGWLQLQGETIRRISVPVELQKVPAGLVVADPGADSVSLLLRGVPARMARVDPQDVRVVLDLSDAVEGVKRFTITEQRIEGIPRKTRVEEVTPLTIRVRLEPVYETEVPVEPVISGQVDAGFMLDAANPVPERVHFRGPESLGNQIKSVRTEKVDLTGLRRSQRVPAALRPPEDRQLRFFEPSVVEVELRLVEVEGERKIEGVLVEPLAQPGLRVQLVPPKVTIIARGAQSRLEALEPGSFTVQAEVRSYGPGRHRDQELRLFIRTNPEREGVKYDYEPRMFDLIVTR